LLIPYQGYANRATYQPENLEVVCRSNCNDSNNTLQLRGVKGLLKTSNVTTRKFEIVRSDDGSNLKTGTSDDNRSRVPVGIDLTYKTILGYPAQGSWFFTGGEHDSPPMDGQWYKLGSEKNPVKNQYGAVKIKVNSPENRDPDRIKTTGPVTCNENTRVCRTTGVGRASITLNFPATNAQVRGDSEGGKRSEDQGEFTFKRTEYTYQFDVFQSNTAPIISSCEASSVGYENGRITWNYSDADGDRQTKAYIQVNSDNNFPLNQNRVNTLINGNNKSFIINGRVLNPETRYYVRVMVNDGKVNSDWRNCGSFVIPNQKPNQKPTVSLTKAIVSSFTNVILEWNYSDVEDDPQAQYNIQISENNNFRTIKVDETISSRNRRQDTVRDLEPGTKYYARIRVSDKYDQDRFSDWSNVREFRTPASSPTSNQKPTVSLTRADSNDTNVTLGWEYKDKEKNPQAKYIIQISKSDNFSPIEVKEEKSSRDRRQDTIRDLEPGTKYYARIKVSDEYNQNRFSAWSNVREFTTENKIIPPGPDPEPETKSEIDIQCSLDKTTVSSSSPTVNITGIKVEGKYYKWRVDRGDNKSLFQNSEITNPQTLDYTGVRFGRYSPFIEIKDKNDNITKKVCGTVTNLGNRNVREVSQ
jgi:hypothetical protein